MKSILPIVEGKGDSQAVPELIRRVLHDHQLFDFRILQPHERGDLPTIKPRFESFFQTAIKEGALIFLVLDFDCDFCESAPDERQGLIDRAHATRPDQPFEVCFMVREYESLFLCDETTTRRVFDDIPARLAFPDNPESVRDAKNWLSKARPKGSAYKPVMHQQKLTAQLDLARLRAHSPSFRDFEFSLLKLIMVDRDPAVA